MHTHTFALILSAAVMPALADNVLAGPLDSIDVESQEPETTSVEPFLSATGWSTPGTAPLQLSQAGLTPHDEQEADYLESVTREAAHSDPAGHQPRERGAESAAGADSPAHAPGRVDAIRGIVSEALASPKPEKVEMDAKEITPPLAKGRRERLEEAVITAPPPKDSPGDNYISVLKDEVETTVVVEEGGPTGRPAGSAARTGREVYSYTVRPGDSLWNISNRVYGDGFRWTAIYDANRDAITNANVLLVGQRLRIPKE